MPTDLPIFKLPATNLSTNARSKWRTFHIELATTERQVVLMPAELAQSTKTVIMDSITSMVLEITATDQDTIINTPGSVLWAPLTLANPFAVTFSTVAIRLTNNSGATRTIEILSS